MRKLGANYDTQNECVIFRLFSKNATRVVLAIFEKADDIEALANFELTRGEDDIWQTTVKKYALFNLSKPFYYVYHVFGDEKWFEPEKLAYDPYSTGLVYKKGIEDFDKKSIFV